MRNVVIGIAGLTVLAAAACSRLGGLHSKHAVEEAIQAHLRQNPGLSLDKFTTEIEDVKFNGDTAAARVKFQSKESAQLTVEVGYGLRRQGDHWEVVSSAPLSGQGANPHSAAAGSTGTGTATPAPQPAH